ncbi:hypothetical protein B566_EDAN011426 [Ephemera danica]|nr:hypothetical protein B566_EDAN011426 [Ephemera danica]
MSHCQQANYYSTKYAPPKKVSQTPTLSDNVQKFLAKKAEEERLKKEEEERKRYDLLALRAQDSKSKKRVSLMLKSTKSASKAAIADARDDNDTAVTMLGKYHHREKHSCFSPSQPDEDDYGYTSKEASSFYEQLMNKYQNTPHEQDKFSKKQKTSVKSVSQINDTKKRVLEAMEKQRMEEMMPHRRKRRPKDNSKEGEGDCYEDDGGGEDNEPEPAPKPKRPAAPPIDFRELLKIAAQKQHEPVVVEPKVPARSDEEDRPMTKRERREYERQKQWRERRETEKLSSQDSAEAETSLKKPEAIGGKPTFTRIPKKNVAGSAEGQYNGQKPAAPSKPTRDEYQRDSHSPSQSQLSSKFNGTKSYSDKDGSNRMQNKHQNSSGLPSKSKLREELSKSKDSLPGSGRSIDSEPSKKFSGEKRQYPDQRSQSSRPPESSRPTDRRVQDQAKRPQEPARKAVQDRSRSPENEKRFSSDKRALEKPSIDRRREEQDRRPTSSSKVAISQERKLPPKTVDKVSGSSSDKKLMTSDKRPGQPANQSADRKPMPGPVAAKRPEERKSIPETRPVTSGVDRKPMPTSADRRTMPPGAEKRPMPASADRRPMPTSAERRPMPPGVEKIPMPTSSDRRPMSASTDKRPIPPGADRRPIPPGADRKLMPPGADRRPIPPEADRRPIASGADRRPIPPGADRRPIPPGADRRPMPPGADRRPMPPGADRRPMPPGADRRPMPPGADRRPMPPGGPMPPGADRRPMPPGAPMQGQQRPQMSNGRIESDSEYDSDLADFIDDGPEEPLPEDVSEIIGKIFNYNRNKYRNIDDDDECMESNFAQQQREEFVSAKLGLMEDLEDIQKEQMEKKRARKKAAPAKKRRK